MTAVVQELLDTFDNLTHSERLDLLGVAQMKDELSKSGNQFVFKVVN